MRPGPVPRVAPRNLVFLPFSLLYLAIFVLFILLVPFLVLTVGDILGLTPLVTALVFAAIIVGSLVNIPVAEVEVHRPVLPPFQLPLFRQAFGGVLEKARTVVAVNVGGAIIPAILSAYFIWQLPPMGRVAALLAVVAVTAITHAFARPVAGLGIAIPPLVPPLASVAASTVLLSLLGVPLTPHVAPVAFSAGVLGAIVGADVLNLRRVGELGAAVVSVGGAGTFDGVFLSGVFATLFAAFFFP